MFRLLDSIISSLVWLVILCAFGFAASRGLASSRAKEEDTNENSIMDNRMGVENEFLLDLVPSNRLDVVGNLLGRIDFTLKLTNRADTDMTFKIKCTSNDMFSIRPPIGEIKPSRSVTINIRYRCYDGAPPNPNLHHYFIVYHIPQPVDSYPDGTWLEHYGPAQGEKRLSVRFFHNPA